MARIDFVSPIIRSALTYLQAHYADHVAVYNAEPANLIDLEVPASYVFGAATVMDVYPILEATILDGTMGPFSVGQAGVGDADSTPRLNVVLWLQGVTGEVPDLYEAGLGHVRVIIEQLCEQGALGANAEVAGDRSDAIDWRVDTIPGGPANVERELRKWRLPCQVSFAVEAVDNWV